MYYHVTVISKKNNESGNFDLTEETVINEYCKPYESNKDLFFDDRTYAKSEIKDNGFKVFTSELPAQELYDNDPEKFQFTSMIDAVKSENNTKDITKKILNKTRQLLEPTQQPQSITQTVNYHGNAQGTFTAAVVQNSPVSLSGTFYVEPENKQNIENFLRALETTLQQQNIQNAELASAIATLHAALQPQKPHTKIISFALDAISNIVCDVLSSTVYSALIQQFHI